MLHHCVQIAFSLWGLIFSSGQGNYDSKYHPGLLWEFLTISTIFYKLGLLTIVGSIGFQYVPEKLWATSWVLRCDASSENDQIWGTILGCDWSGSCRRGLILSTTGHYGARPLDTLSPSIHNQFLFLLPSMLWVGQQLLWETAFMLLWTSQLSKLRAKEISFSLWSTQQLRTG